MIQGGVPLSGEIIRRRQQERGPADPRRLPAHGGGCGVAERASDPRHRGPDRDPRQARGRSRMARRERSAAFRSGVGTTEVDEGLAARIRAWFLLAGRSWPASARSGCRPPRGHDRPSPPPSAPRRLPRPGATVTGSRIDRAPASRGLDALAIFTTSPPSWAPRRAAGGGAGAGPDADRDSAATARPGPRAPARPGWARPSRDRLT